MKQAIRFEDMDGDTQAAEFLRPRNAGKNAETTLTIEYLKHDKHFESDKEARDIYKVTLERGGRSYSFNFGTSVQASGKWAAYRWNKGGGRIFASDNLTEFGKTALKRVEELNKADRSVKRMPISRQNHDCVNIKKNKDFKAPSEYDVLACLTTNDPGLFADFCGDYGYDEDSRTAEKTYNAVREEFLNLERLFTPAQMERLGGIQ